MYSRLMSFFRKTCCLYDKQFGFRTNHNTTQAVLLITDKIQRAIDTGFCSCGIFLDLCMTFDTVDHKMLLSKLENYGIRGTPHD